MKISDEDLMLKLKEGGEGFEECFSELVERYRQPISNFIGRFLNDYDAAEDLTQEVFLRVYKGIEKYEVRAKFTTWLYRIATNLCLNEQRRRNELTFVSLSTTVAETEDEEIELFETIADESVLLPDRVFEAKESKELIKKAIASLSERHRMVYEMAKLQGIDYKTIAKELGCSLGTVKSRVHYASKEIEQRLKQMGERP